MRIHLKLSPNSEIIPFDYQQLLAGVLHKWIGKNNDAHNSVSLYCFSWLKNGKAEKNGIKFRYGANWFISSHDMELIKQIVTSIHLDPTLFKGMQVQEITLQQDPEFGSEQKFAAASPIFIKRREGERVRFHYFDEPEADTYLTETLITKLQKAGLNTENVSVEFDRNYPNPSKKGTSYKGLKSIGSICPVIIKGSPEQIAFAWNVGLGNSTGIGFGALI